jgi:protein TonB
MEKLSILTADLLDIIFEYRNKLYGAYDLRKTYPRRIGYAMAGTILLCLLFVGGTMLANGKKVKANVDYVTDIEFQKIDEPKPEPPPPIPPKQEVPKMEITRFTPPEIVQDDQVKPDDEIKEVEKLEDTKIGTINQEGLKDDDIVAPLVEKVGPVVAAPKVEEDYDRVVTFVSIEARFNGGREAWTKYLRSHLNSDLPSQNGAPPAKYTVIVSFIVDREGHISDVRAENDPGYGTKQEAIRVIQKGPDWVPAEQNGRKVIYRQKQAITFEVREE